MKRFAQEESKMNTTPLLSNFDSIIAICKDEDIQFASDYGERGYTLDDNKKGILLGDWNNTPNHIQNHLDKYFELEWHDEWVIDYDSDKIYRCVPDSYHWQPSYIMTEDCEVVGHDELIDNLESYIDIWLNDYNQAINIDDSSGVVDALENIGFTQYNGCFESGFYGVNDDPKKIVDRIPDFHDYVFIIDSSGQFRVNFKVFIKERF